MKVELKIECSDGLERVLDTSRNWKDREDCVRSRSGDRGKTGIQLCMQ